MGNRIYVKNIPYSTKRIDILKLFQNAGQVLRVHILKDKMTGQSKGAAIVEMANDRQAYQAIERYDEFRLGGRFIKVLSSNY